MKKTIHAALVGFGLSGRAFHAPFLHVNTGFNLKTIVQRTGKDASALYPYALIATDIHQVLSDPTIDLVVVCTPNIHHYDMVKQSLLAGKHVVIEKPFTNTYAEAMELIHLAEEMDLHIFAYQNRRWDSDFLTIRKVFRSGVLGDIQYYEAHFDRYSPERKRAAWRDENQPGSGILYDLGPHLIDQALVLFGLPETIQADIQMQREGTQTDDFFELKMHYPRHTVMLTAGMLVEDPGPRYIIHSLRGSFIKYGVDPQEAALRQGILPNAENWGEESPEQWGLVTIDYDDLNFDGRVESEPGNYMQFYNNVYDVLTGDAKQAVAPREAANVIRVIEKAFVSSRAGKAVDW